MMPYLSDDGKRIFCCGVPVVIYESPYTSNKILVTYEGGEFEANNNCAVYGGYDSINNEVGEVAHTSITMNGGKVYSLNGSNWGPGTIDSVRIIFNDGKADFVSAGIGEGASDVISVWSTWYPIPGAKCHITKSDIIINGGIVDSAYGGLGGGCGFVENASLTITGGELRYATGTNSISAKSSSSPIVGSKNVLVNVTGGEIQYLYGCSESSCGNVTMNVTGGEIGLCTMYGYNLYGDAPKTKIDANLMGGTVDKLCVYANEQISSKHASMMENVDISYAPGVINEADVANSPKEIKEDPYKGQGAIMKTIRFYPFPHKCDRVFGILENDEAIDRPCELPMSEQEIRMCLGMGHVFEVVDGKLILLDNHNYNQDNSGALEFAGELPCDDCDLVYPRKSEEEEKPVKKKAIRKTAKQEEFTPIPPVGTIDETKPAEEVKPAEQKKEETAKVEEVKEK